MIVTYIEETDLDDTKELVILERCYDCILRETCNYICDEYKKDMAKYIRKYSFLACIRLNNRIFIKYSEYGMREDI